MYTFLSFHYFDYGTNVNRVYEIMCTMGDEAKHYQLSPTEDKQARTNMALGSLLAFFVKMFT